MLGKNRKQWTRMILLAAAAVVALAIVSGVVAVSAVVEAQGKDIVLDRGRLADSARLQALADSHLMGGSSRGRTAEAGRLTALADSVLNRDEGGCEGPSLTRGQGAEAARLTGQATHYLGSSAPRVIVLNRGQLADVLRLAGLASSLNADPSLVSSEVACALGR